MSILLDLLRVLLPLSFLSIGGGQSIIPELHHQSVQVYGWLTNSEFLDLFALTRLTPGPKSLLISLIGWKAAGLLGALVATIAIFMPTMLLVYFLAKVWRQYENTRLIKAVEQGLAPVAAGMILAATATMIQASQGGVWSWLVTLITTILLFSVRISVFVLLAMGGIVFYFAQPVI